MRSGRYVPRWPGARERALRYLEQLDAHGRYHHMVWPVHCEIGTWGHNVHAALRVAYNRWEERTLGGVRKLAKGDRPWTEHYSAIQAEVPDAKLTRRHCRTLRSSPSCDAPIACTSPAGEAGSHCVKATTEHLVAQLSDAELQRLVLVTDCMSPVRGFEAAYQRFVADMRARGIATITAADVEQELRENAA